MRTKLLLMIHACPKHQPRYGNGWSRRTAKIAQKILKGERK